MALSAEQQQALGMFKDVTHEVNDEACVGTLEAFDWDLEAAINGFLATGHHAAPRRPMTGLHTTTATQRRAGSQRPAAPMGGAPFGYVAGQRHRFNGPAAATGGGSQGFGWVAWIVYIVFMPLRVVLKIVSVVLYPVLSIIGADPSALQPRADEDLGQATLDFIRRSDAKYGTEHPDFYPGAYYQAVAQAKQELMPLVLYLHSDDHHDTPEFCRRILGDARLRALTEGRCVFWANSVKSTEGWRVSDTLQVSSFPCVAVLVAVDSQLRMVDKIEGLLPVDEYMRRFQNALDTAGAETAVAKQEREERLWNQRLRDEQDMAFKESLERDREKERKRKEEEDKKREEEERLRQQEEDEQRQIEEMDMRRKRAFEALPPEPATGEPNITALTLKMPDGKRLQRRFRHTETIQHVHDFVAGQDPEAHDIPDNFVLCSNFPRREFSDHSQTLADAGLTRAEMLMVHDLD